MPLVTDTNQIVTDFPLATVEVKDTLDDAVWTPVPFLFVDKLTLAVNAYDEAELTRYIGDMVQPGAALPVFLDWLPVDLVGKFVRITISQDTQYDEDNTPLDDIVWVGYVVGNAKQRSAVKQPENPFADKKLQGRQQVLTAVGLEYFLDRVQIQSAYVYKELPESPAPDDLNYSQIQRVIPFNGGQGVSLDADTRTRANRSAATNAEGAYTFVPANETGELWTLGNVIYYLMTYFTTRDSNGNPSPTTYSLDNIDVLAATLDGIAPTFNPEGMTPFQVLNKLVSPQRGFVWWLEFTESPTEGHSATIRVETITASAITLPSLGTIPANRDQQTVDFDQQRDVDDVIVAKVGSRHYHQVIARGARMTSTCTLGNVDDDNIPELVHDWTIDIESLYQLAAAETDGYGDLDESEQAKRNDAFRQSERLSRAFSYFRLSTAWDGKTSDGTEAERNWAFPALAEDGSFEAGQEFSVNGLRILNHTRLKRGWNYANASAVEDTTPEGTEADYMATFAILLVATADGDAADKYQFVEKIHAPDFGGALPVSDEINVGYTLHPQQTCPGIILNASGVQHACALNHWEGASSTETEPQLDYETLRVTCTMEADSYCEAKYPDDIDLPANVPLQKLLLYVGDEYRLDYLAANTVVDLDNGEPVLTNGGVLRDDRKRLADVARVAYEWYQQDRQPITVKFQQIRNVWRLGMFITAIGSGTTQENVNTVVSIIEYDCEKGLTTIKTHDAALDIAKVA